MLQRQSSKITLPQEAMISEDGKSITGCFLDPQQFSIQWYNEKFVQSKAGYNYQTETPLPSYYVDYPILCFSGIMPDRSKLQLVNLADKSSPVTELKFENMQLLCFVGQNRCYDGLKISFLALDHSYMSGQSSALTDHDDEKVQSEDNVEKYEQGVVHCILSLDKVFEKKFARDLSYIALKKEFLGDISRQSLFRKHLAAATQIESVHDLDKQDSKLFFIMQSESALFIISDDGKENKRFEQIS